MIFSLPTELTLTSCFNLPNQIQITSQKKGNQNTAQTQQVLKLVESYHPVIKQKYYPPSFVKLFLLIKLNALSKPQCVINPQLLKQLSKLYNISKFDSIYVSDNEAGLISQIISKIQTSIPINKDEFTNIIEGNGLLAASCVWLIQQAQKYLKKQQFAFCLSFAALGGREQAFTPIVHKQKNHAGQIYFAKRIFDLVHIEQKSKKEEIKVQDPYSMRCSPQVHGVAYDCLEELRAKIKILVNKPHHKYINFNGKTIFNLLQQSDTFSLKMDFLICSLQQIGAMSFLRLQRILNQYLGKNKLKRKQQYSGLFSMMNTAQSLASQNKLLCEMTNFDTSNTDSYNKDIFYNSGCYFIKIQELVKNLYFIMTTQILCSLEALRDAYEGHEHNLTFNNPQMQSTFKYLSESTSSWDRTNSLLIVKETWKL